MKIKIADIKNNPFRDLGRYPIDRAKVENLKSSIDETGFWDNIMARPDPNGIGYQLAYGHHRLFALEELGIDEIDIPVKDLSDAMMLKIMANENYDTWGKNAQSTLETVRVTREFLDTELAKHETWESISNESIRVLFDSQKSFDVTKGMGVGQTTILKFLGDPWSQWEIQKSLSAIKDEETYELLLPVFEYVTDLNDFRKSLKRKKEQRENDGLPEYANNEILEMAQIVADKKKRLKERKSKGRGKSPKTNIKTETDEMLDQTEENDFDEKINDLAIDIQRANKSAMTLKNNLLSINTSLSELRIEQLENFPIIIDSIDSFGSLFQGVEMMLSYFGINFNTEYKKLNHEKEPA